MKFHKISTLRELELVASEKTKVDHCLKSTCDMFNMSCVAGKTCLRGFRPDPTNRAAKPQKMARGLIFRIKEVEGLYYLHVCSVKKDADQMICAFLFSHMQKAGLLPGKNETPRAKRTDKTKDHPKDNTMKNLQL